MPSPTKRTRYIGPIARRYARCMMVAIHAAVALALAVSAPHPFAQPGAPAPQGDSPAAKLEDPVFDAAAAMRRLTLVNMGPYQIEKSGQPRAGMADVHLCLRAMQQRSTTLVVAGCNGIRALAGRAFFAVGNGGIHRRVVNVLIQKLSSSHGRTANAATSALTRMASVYGHNPLQFTDRIEIRLSLTKPLIQPDQSRRIATKALAMTMQGHPDVQYRAGSLLRAMANNVNSQMPGEMCRTLLAAIYKHGLAAAAADSKETDGAAIRRRLRGIAGLKAALATVPTPDGAIAVEKVALFLQDARGLKANHRNAYSEAHALHGIAECVTMLDGKRRRQVIECLVKRAADRELRYMVTSGERSPFLHHGVQALNLAVPHLTRAELDSAHEAVTHLRSFVEADIARGGGRGLAHKKKDLASMFGEIEVSIRAREKVFAQTPHPYVTKDRRNSASQRIGGNPKFPRRKAPHPEQQAIETGLQWLATNETTGGGWGNATRFVLLAVLAHGSTTVSGPYQRSVRRAVTILSRPRNADAKAPDAQADAVTAWALAEAAVLSQDKALLRTASSHLVRLLHQRRDDGSWAREAGTIGHRYPGDQHREPCASCRLGARHRQARSHPTDHRLAPHSITRRLRTIDGYRLSTVARQRVSPATLHQSL